MPEMDGYAAARAIRHCGKPDAKTTPTDNGGLVGRTNTPCLVQGVFILGLFRGDRAGERLPLFRG